MTSGELYRFHGVDTNAATEAMMPPVLKLIRLGFRFDRSKAAETKFATMLTPMVATTKTTLPASTMYSFSTSSSSAAGSSTASPYTSTDAADTRTEVSANAVQLNGSPHALPFTTSAREGEKRAKSEKLSMSVASTPTVNPTAANVWYTRSPADSCSSPPPRVQLICQPA